MYTMMRDLLTHAGCMLIIVAWKRDESIEKLDHETFDVKMKR